MESFLKCHLSFQRQALKPEVWVLALPLVLWKFVLIIDYPPENNCSDRTVGYPPLYLYFNEICAFISLVPFTWERPSSASAPFVISVWGYRSRGRNDIFPKLSQLRIVLCCLSQELCPARNPILWRADKERSSPSWSLHVSCWLSHPTKFQKLQLEVAWAPFTSPMPGSVLSHGCPLLRWWWMLSSSLLILPRKETREPWP